MGRLWNKCARFVIKHFFSTGLEQDLSHIKLNEKLRINEIGDLAKKVAAEGVVLLKNEDNCLPLLKEDKVAVFGRCAIDYFCVGYGSGGDVIPPYKKNLMDGLDECEVNYDKELFDIYKTWTSKKNNIPDEGYWGHWPMCFNEMNIKENVVKQVSDRCNKAIVVIGRAAGEDRENKLIKGSYYLTNKERKLLDKVTKYFDDIIIVMDCGNVIDLSFTLDYPNKIKSIVYAWLGGMEAGSALANVLTNKINPSGRLTMSIAKDYKDYPSSNNFGNKEFNNYVEDIYVGYRYFDTFASDKILYPFGFGLSYSLFETNAKTTLNKGTISLDVNVKNKGPYKGKEVVQVYLHLPSNRIGNPKRVLVNFAKTNELDVKSEENISMQFALSSFASYDEKTCSYVLLKGDYKVEINNEIVYEFSLDKEEVVSKHEEVLRIEKEYAFDRLINRDGQKAYEEVPYKTKDLRKTILDTLPNRLENIHEHYITFDEVLNGLYTVEELVAQLSYEELNEISHGEGKMNSKLGPSNNGGAFGGVSDNLKKRKIPHIITTDGPSGIRLHTVCALLPCGVALASSFNKEIVQQLYSLVGEEMKLVKSDMLLAPGMNIHRDPLCGRNFEYLSEDPYLSGSIASSIVKGIESSGLSACPKHFACNNQETNRNKNDSRVSERALREIYLKGFEIVVKEAKPKCIMTSYNKINGVYSHYNYDLATTVLRKEWGYDGLVITDWWMQEDVSKEFPNISNDAYRIRAQVDVLMPGEFGKKEEDLTLVSSLKDKDGVRIEEAQRVALNVLNLIIKIKKSID